MSRSGPFSAPRTGSPGFYELADAAWPLSVLFVLVSGTAVARAEVLAGWSRFAVVGCGSVLPMAIVAGGVFGRNGMGEGRIARHVRGRSVQTRVRE